MIIGAIALIGILLGGGFTNLFFVDGLEKGVKEYVVDKEKKKEILEDLKASQAFYKDFEKSRKKDLKAFNELNKSFESKQEDIQVIFTRRMTARRVIQDSMINQRIRIVQKFSDDEWNSIIEFSKETYKKELEKNQKKAQKSEPEIYFEKTRKAILENISDSLSIDLLIKTLDDQLSSFERLGEKISEFNVEENTVLVNKEATEEDFTIILITINELRESGFDQVMKFHFLLKENSTEASFKKVINAYSNDISLTPR